MDGTTPLGVDEHIDPAHKHPERALCAAGGFYPPLRVAAAEPPTGRQIGDPYRDGESLR